MNFKHASLALILGTASLSANASLIGGSCGGGESEPVCTAEWSDSWTGQQFLSTSRGKDADWEYTFDITDSGFKPGEDVINDYSLSFKLSDDGDRTLEFAKVFQAGQRTDFWEVDFGTIGLEGSARGEAQLNEFGNLTVRLLAVSGDFWLKGAELFACGVDNAPAVSVPEPSSLALLGLGLLGLGVARRNQRNAQ